jgi:hypothetical protein
MEKNGKLTKYITSPSLCRQIYAHKFSDFLAVNFYCLLLLEKAGIRE